MADDRRPDAPPATPEAQVSNDVARRFFGAGSDLASRRRAARRWLAGAAGAALLIPLLSLLWTGRVPPPAWGLTAFCAAFCLLAAVGIHMVGRPEYHTPVKPWGDWQDRFGAFWLVACAFGPLAGWLLTAVFTLTPGTWWWLYAVRVVLSVGLPGLTALSLVRYVEGRGAPVMLALLIGITALPVWSGWATLQDLRSGPVAPAAGVAPEGAPSPAATYLPHTDRTLVTP